MTAPFITAQGVQTVRDALDDYPRPDRAAADAVRNWASSRGLELNPDKVDAVTLHYQVKGQRCIARIVQNISMTQALLSNWQGESNNNLIGAALHEAWAGDPPPYPITLVDHLDEHGLFDNGAEYLVYNGLYRQVSPATFDAAHHVRIPAEDFQQFIWHLDFHRPYGQMLKTFWKDGLNRYRDAAKVNFIAACNRQVSNASLSDAGRVLAWQVAGLQTRPHAVHVACLNIYGYAATNLLCLKNTTTGLTLLYIPGNSSPFHEFADESAMKHWVAEQCKHPHTRQALESHFPPGDEADTLGFSGLNTALTGLGLYPAYHHFDPDRHPGFATSGLWAPNDTVNYRTHTYSPPIEGDLFLAMAKQQKKRSEQDADFIISTDSSVTKEKWRGYIDSAINTLAPIAMVVPELAPIFGLGGLIELGLGLDRAINAKTLAQRADGAVDAAWGLLNAEPLLHLQLPKRPAIFRVKRPEFVVPARINGQIGYPLSPVQAPHLPPIEPILETAFSLPHAVPPVAGARQDIAEAIIRVPSYTGKHDILECEIDGYVADVHYDLERNAFIQSMHLNDIDPPYYVAPRPGERSLARLKNPDRPVTDAQRMETLQALGVDLILPMSLGDLRPPVLKPIPQRISCIWVGNKLISPALLENVGRNAALLRESNYQYTLFLSTASPDIYARNVELLAEHAPSMEVLPLESQPLYDEFKQSPYYPQYKAAIAGNGGAGSNFASASDVLRYRVLYSKGGLYMDLDDSILPPAHRTPLGQPSVAIDTVPLQTSNRGLILSVPMSNETLGMNIQYGNSMIGSHPGNPTLNAISDTLRERFEAQPDFYDSRPDAHHDPEGFQRYAIALNHISGPGALTDTINQRLLELAQYREVWNLSALPIRDNAGVLDWSGFGEAYRTLTPLNRFSQVGSNLSWTHT
ncbi:mannosyltransferase [Pseudomonas putida]|nr:mannosyltransferase [Pseudomonas putida]